MTDGEQHIEVTVTISPLPASHKQKKTEEPRIKNFSDHSTTYLRFEKEYRHL
jgi:hypothetical protein